MGGGEGISVFGITNKSIVSCLSDNVENVV
jgi:hypothetical protein